MNLTMDGYLRIRTGGRPYVVSFYGINSVISSVAKWCADSAQTLDNVIAELTNYTTRFKKSQHLHFKAD